MSEEEKNTQEVENQPDKVENQPEQGEQTSNFTCLYVSIGCFAVGVILFILAFFIYNAGVYLLIASMISELASVSFLNGQKRRGENKLCFIMKILSYVVMIAGVIVILIGMSVTTAAKQ